MKIKGISTVTAIALVFAVFGAVPAHAVQAGEQCSVAQLGTIVDKTTAPDGTITQKACVGNLTVGYQWVVQTVDTSVAKPTPVPPPKVSYPTEPPANVPVGTVGTPCKPLHHNIVLSTTVNADGSKVQVVCAPQAGYSSYYWQKKTVPAPTVTLRADGKLFLSASSTAAKGSISYAIVKNESNPMCGLLYVYGSPRIYVGNGKVKNIKCVAQAKLVAEGKTFLSNKVLVTVNQ